MKSIKLIFILLITQVSACSYFFPDKEKDYVNSKEIAPLDIPPDLQAQDTLTQQDPMMVPITLTNTITRVDDGLEIYLRINSPFAHAWRVVGKALTASSVEITDKNRADALYYVQYDPNMIIIEDGSFWDELVFFFGDDPNQERPYQIYLTQTELGVNIYVRDDFGDTLNNGDGLKLLDLLFETIQEDFAR